MLVQNVCTLFVQSCVPSILRVNYTYKNTLKTILHRRILSARTKFFDKTRFHLKEHIICDMAYFIKIVKNWQFQETISC